MKSRHGLIQHYRARPDHDECHWDTGRGLTTRVPQARASFSQLDTSLCTIKDMISDGNESVQMAHLVPSQGVMSPPPPGGMNNQWMAQQQPNYGFQQGGGGFNPMAMNQFTDPNNTTFFGGGQFQNTGGWSVPEHWLVVSSVQRFPAQQEDAEALGGRPGGTLGVDQQIRHPRLPQVGDAERSSSWRRERSTWASILVVPCHLYSRRDANRTESYMYNPHEATQRE
ncbi:hypothetical protein PG985_014528 [Apiospora marii]|uniref:Uncharacterized protein n=1 Tax=Apiospora marii TaxID=335849 RepID=A0ABR1R4X2_9PEZI